MPGKDEGSPGPPDPPILQMGNPPEVRWLAEAVAEDVNVPLFVLQGIKSAEPEHRLLFLFRKTVRSEDKDVGDASRMTRVASVRDEVGMAVLVGPRSVVDSTREVRRVGIMKLQQRPSNPSGKRNTIRDERKNRPPERELCHR